MKHNIILLGLKPYDFTDDKGNRIAGASAWVLPLEEGKNTQGLIPIKYSIPLEEVQKLSQVQLPASGTLHLAFDLLTSKARFSSFSDLNTISLMT